MGVYDSAERVSLEVQNNYLFQRSIKAYYEAATIISGKVLEIGTGSGYGVEIISGVANEFITVDKFDTKIDFSKYPNVKFVQGNVPPLDFEANTFDSAITFQVVEHIKDHHAFIREIHRVLKPGGKLVITTPNIKMSITRNPWHIREYTVDQFRNLLSTYFSSVEAKGVYGNEKSDTYYQNNKKSVQKILKWDVLRMNRWLPRQVLQIPYDIMNKRNRKKLMTQDTDLANSFTHEDFYVKKADNECFDLFFIATK
jgi:ubiquinone/menaquinone biosynthesis C-methylase UbiE